MVTIQFSGSRRMPLGCMQNSFHNLGLRSGTPPGVRKSCLRLSTYAINAFKSSGGRSMGGLPPAFIFAVGCLKSSASCSGENLAFMPTNAGAAAVPTPASPWQALQDCA